MIQSTLDAIENDPEAIFDGRIADTEIVKQNKRFAGLMRQAGGPREGLEILAKQTPESIARLFIATDSFRHFVKSATSIPLSSHNDVILNDLGPGAPVEIRAFLKDSARKMAGRAWPQ